MPPCQRGTLGSSLFSPEPRPRVQAAASHTGQQSQQQQQRAGLQRGRCSPRASWERPWAWAQRVSGPLSSCSLWCQAVSEGGGPRPDPGRRRAACHILVDSVQSQPWLLLWSGREHCGAGRPRRKLCRERRREPRRVQSRSWGSLGLPGWWGMRSRAWRLGPSAAGLQRVMNSRQEASRRKMQAKAMSTGRGAAASTGLPGVPVVGGLRPSVLMAPATGMGQKLRGKSAGPRPGEGNMGGGWALLNQQQVASQPFYSEAHRGDSLRSHSGKTMELGLNSGSVSLPAGRGGARNFIISPHESQ